MQRCRTARWYMPVNRKCPSPWPLQGPYVCVVVTEGKVLLLLNLPCRFYQMTGYGADEVLGHNW